MLSLHSRLHHVTRLTPAVGQHADQGRVAESAADMGHQGLDSVQERQDDGDEDEGDESQTYGASQETEIWWKSGQKWQSFGGQ